MRGELAVAMPVTTVAALASFDIVYVTTNGGPGEQTTVPGLLVYRLAFSEGKVGLAAALAVVPASLVLATLAGYALGTMRLPGGNAVAAFFGAGLTIPVEPIVVPLYFDLRGLGLTNSHLGVILVGIALFMPFSVFWMRTHFQSTPASLVEAARIDGASAADRSVANGARRRVVDMS
jgi:ABC-type sugar transport system permease subunit